MLGEPRLIHPIPVKVRVRRKDLSLMDNDAREPIGKVVRDVSKDLIAQISWNKEQSEASPGGEVKKTEGYLLFRVIDLHNAGVTLSSGDKITEIGTGISKQENLVLYIYRLDPCIYIPALGGHRGLKAYFGDKKPVRQN